MQIKFCKMLAASFLASSLSISVANAFVVDTKLGEAFLPNSGDATEINWIRSVTGDNSLTIDFKIDNNDTNFNFAQNGPDSWFIDVGSEEPGFFMLKFGTGNTNATADHFIFQNTAEMTKLVWSNDQVQFLTGGNCADNPASCNIGRLSHYVGTGGGGGGGETEIPEPTILVLMGFGLAGIALTRRFKFI